MYQVYKIENMINHQVYIGSTTDINTRWRHHQYCAFNPNDHHYNYPLMKAFREFGVENFQFSIIETLNSFQDMIDAEQQWIIKENCIYPNGYNQTVRTDSPMFDPIISKKMSQTKREKYGKKVCEIDSQNNILQIWDSLAEASEKTGLDRFKISAVCNGNRITTGNRLFRFLDESLNIVEPVIKVNKTQTNRITKNSRKVAAYDLNNNLIQKFNSLQLAAQFCNGNSSTIAAVCRGKRNTHKGYVWRYID